MCQLYQDSMSIVRDLGKPDIFIPFTCYPYWPEIKRELNGSQASERPDLCIRVFNIKLKLLLEDILKKHVFEILVGYICYRISITCVCLPIFNFRFKFLTKIFS